MEVPNQVKVSEKQLIFFYMGVGLTLLKVVLIFLEIMENDLICGFIRSFFRQIECPFQPLYFKIPKNKIFDVLQDSQSAADAHHSAYSRLSGFSNTMGSSRDSSNYFSSMSGMASHLNPYAAYAQNMMSSAWNTYGMATLQGFTGRGITYGKTSIIGVKLCYNVNNDVHNRSSDG